MHLFIVDIFIIRTHTSNTNDFVNLKYKFYNRKDSEQFIDSNNFQKIKQMFQNDQFDYIIQEQYISK